MELKSVQNLLNQVNTVAKHSEELSKLNGENFNIFSILGLESNENKTHSNFLAALLNPKGTHGMSNLYLDLFIKHINLNNVDFETESATVIVENSLGLNDFENKTGGRVDIDIISSSGFSIVIENKIYAGDQYAQIERYKNYKGVNCVVYYLTLEGKEPSDDSKGELISGVDFHCISYKEHILNWLEECIKEASQQPILRETIKQYIILIKKLTGQLTNHKMENDILKLIQSNFESASLIKSNFDNARYEIAEKVRHGLATRLNDTFSDKYIVRKWGNISDTYSKILIHPRKYFELDLPISIECFSGNGHYGGRIFIGLLDIEQKNKSYFIEKKLKIDGWYRGLTMYHNFLGETVSFKNLALLQQLANNPKEIDNLIDALFEETSNYINQMEEIHSILCEQIQNDLNKQIQSI